MHVHSQPHIGKLSQQSSDDMYNWTLQHGEKTLGDTARLSKHLVIPPDKNGGHTLFSVDARSDEMIVRKTLIIELVYLFSEIVVCAISEAAFGEILVWI